MPWADSSGDVKLCPSQSRREKSIGGETVRVCPPVDVSWSQTLGLPLVRRTQVDEYSLLFTKPAPADPWPWASIPLRRNGHPAFKKCEARGRQCGSSDVTKAKG
jgi:hypothetical protein